MGGSDKSAGGSSGTGATKTGGEGSDLDTSNINLDPKGTYFYDKEAQKQVESYFGKKLTKEELLAMIGANEYGVPINFVNIMSTANGLSVTLRGLTQPDGSFLAVSRTFGIDNQGRKFVHNNVQFLPTSAQGQGVGRRAFKKYIQNAHAHGIQYMETLAGRDAFMNGYYTWPLFGYNGPLSTGERQRAQQSGFRGVKNVRDLYNQPGGASWWKQNGNNIDLTFDLRPGSQNRKDFNAYDAAAAARAKARRGQ